MSAFNVWGRSELASVAIFLMFCGGQGNGRVEISHETSASICCLCQKGCCFVQSDVHDIQPATCAASAHWVMERPSGKCTTQAGSTGCTGQVKPKNFCQAECVARQLKSRQQGLRQHRSEIFCGRKVPALPPGINVGFHDGYLMTCFQAEGPPWSSPQCPAPMISECVCFVHEDGWGWIQMFKMTTG